MDMPCEICSLAVTIASILITMLVDDVETLLTLFRSGISNLAPLLGTFHRRNLSRMSGFVEQLVPQYDFMEFRRHFRVTRSTADILINSLRRCAGIPSDSQDRRGGRAPISVEKQLLITLWVLASQETYRSVADRFGVCEASVYRTVRRVVETIVRQWTSDVISWPSTDYEIERISDGFHRHAGLRKVIGAVDGSHIPIKAPSRNQESYINRKSFHSIVLQGVCNHQLYFIDCFAGYPGSTHDARVLRNSDLFAKAMDPGNSLFPLQTYLLGDSAYPLTTWLMPPFRDNGHLSDKQIHYNYLHSSTRMVIERAFALLKGRFRRLKYMDIDRVEDIPSIILACCTLHNICLLSEDDIEYFLDDVTNNERSTAEIWHHDCDTAGDATAAKHKRYQIMEVLWREQKQ